VHETDVQTVTNQEAAVPAFFLIIDIKKAITIFLHFNISTNKL